MTFGYSGMPLWAFCVYILFNCRYPVLPPVLHMVPPLQFCMSQLYILFRYITYSPRPGTDPVLYPASGGKRTPGAISV